jgi:hypothetical protein
LESERQGTEKKEKKRNKNTKKDKEQKWKRWAFSVLGFWGETEKQ